jgi:uncharacterized membrane protein YdjX (TVP38/TMEM64 family)
VIWGALAGAWGRVQGWMVALAAGVAVVAGAFLAGRRAARDAAAARALGRDLERREVRDVVDRSVARESDAAGRLQRDWRRD